MVFPVVSQTLIEGAILLRSDVLRVTRPNGFRLIELLVGDLLLFDGLLLFLFLALFIFVDLFNLGLLSFLLLDFLFVLNLLELA